MDIRVAAYAIIIDGERILLAHWRQGGRSGWTLPGGGIDPGEDPADAAVREILEETGYTAELDELLGLNSAVISANDRFNPADGDLHALRIVYAAHLTGGELRNEIGGSTDKAEWFDLDDVQQLKRVGLVETAIRMFRERRGG